MITVDRDYDELALSSESSTVNSGSFSLSTNTSIHNEYDIDTSMSISGLNSQLFNNNNSKQRYQTQSHYQSYHDNMPISSITDIDQDFNHNNNNNNNLNSQKQLRQEQLHLYNYNHQYNKNKRSNHYLTHTKEIIKPSSSSNNIDTILRRDDNRRKYELLNEANINHNHFLRSLLDTSEEDEDYDADYDEEYNEDNDNTTSTNITTTAATTTSDDMKYNSDDYIYDSLQQEIEQMEDFEAIDALELEQQFQQLNI
jgi:hypothetical protein